MFFVILVAKVSNKYFYKKLRIKSSEESSKLTTKDINEIRKLYSSGDYLQKDLGIKFGINQQQISKIINYKIYSKITLQIKLNVL